MSITLRELVSSRAVTSELRSASITLEHLVLGSLDEDDVLVAVRAGTPPLWGKLQRKKISIAHQGGGCWLASTEYGPPESPEQPLGGTPPAEPGASDPLGYEWSFDTSGQTQHITQSRNTSEKVKRGGGAAEDLEGAIGVSKDGVQGTDIVVPKLEFSITRNFTFVTLDYLRKVRDLTGTVNNDTYFGFPKGEVLFQGAQGQGATDKPPRITFRFAVSKNRTSVFVSDQIEITSKKGWEYLWVAYEDAAGTSSIISRPKAAYVEEVYEYADLTQLGL